MEPIPTIAKRVLFFTCLCGGWNQFQRQQTFLHGILNLFMRRIEPIPTTAKRVVFFTYLCGGWNQFQR
jgi:hypothetical protein